MAELSRLPQPIEEVWEWQYEGACRDKEPEMFFHPDGERGPRAAIARTPQRLSARAALLSRLAAIMHLPFKNLMESGAASQKMIA